MSLAISRPTQELSPFFRHTARGEAMLPRLGFIAQELSRIIHGPGNRTHGAPYQPEAQVLELRIFG